MTTFRRQTLLPLVMALGSTLFAENTTPRKPAPPVPPAKPAPTIDKALYPMNLKDEGFRIPQILDSRMKEIIFSKSSLFYKLPRVYQQYNPTSVVEHRNRETGLVSETLANQNWGIYYSTYEPDFNGNHAFPWEGTFGFNHAEKEGLLEKRYGSFNMLSLPKKNGKRLPIYILNEIPIKWIYPVGTIMAEFLWVRDDSGRKWIFEIRCREKMAGSLTWEPIVLRPVKNRAELLSFLKHPSNWRPPMTYFSLRNVHEDQVAKFEGFVERLPKLDPQQVKTLLSRPFSDVTYEMWSENSATPTSDQDFSIVPKNYSLGLLAIDEVSCAECHRQTQISLWNLIPKEPLIFENPTKVANIRGSDGIFTWHPFGPESISDGKSPLPNPAVRHFDHQYGFVQLIDNVTTEPVDSATYRLTKYVQEALSPYQLPHDKRFVH